MIHQPPTSEKFIALLAIFVTLIGLVTVVVFNLYPRLDIEISRNFYISNRTFQFHGETAIGQFRHVLMGFYYVWYIFCFVALAYVSKNKETLLRLDAKAWVFQILCNIAGPGIIANGIIKEFSGRARPRAIEEFGRSAEFTPVLNWSDQCQSNCSFVSGESSAAFMIFAALALVSGRWRNLLLVGTLLFGGAVSLMRIGQGGHFTSDCILAGVIMVLVACAIYWGMYLRDVARQPLANS